MKKIGDIFFFSQKIPFMSLCGLLCVKLLEIEFGSEHMQDDESCQEKKMEMLCK